MPCASINIGVGSRYTGCHGGANFSGRNTGYYNALATADAWRGGGRNVGGAGAPAHTPAAPAHCSLTDAVAKHGAGTIGLGELRLVLAECGIDGKTVLSAAQRGELATALAARTLTEAARAAADQLIAGDAATLARVMDPGQAMSQALEVARASGRGITKPELTGILQRFEVQADPTKKAPGFAMVALRALGPEAFGSKQAKALAHDLTDGT